jgi:hypothetical protein
VEIQLEPVEYGKLARMARAKKRSPKKEIENITKDIITVLDHFNEPVPFDPRRRSRKEVEALCRPFASLLGWSVPQFHKYAAQVLVSLMASAPGERAVPGVVRRFDQIRQKMETVSRVV